MTSKRPGILVITGNCFYLYFVHLPFLSFSFISYVFSFCYASQLEEECWNYYQLLRLCHDYVITVLSPTFLSCLSHLFAYELPRSNGILLPSLLQFSAPVCTCQSLHPYFHKRSMRWLKVVANFRFHGGRLTSDMITGSTLCYSRYVRIRRLDEKIAILYCHGQKTGVHSKVHKKQQTRKFLDKHVCYSYLRFETQVLLEDTGILS